MTETENIAIIIPNFHEKDEKSYNSLKKEDANTIFLKAARLGNLEKVQDHINSNIDINTANANGLNALHLASKECHVEIVKEVLNHGAAVDACTKKGNTALHIASLAGHLDVVNLLVERGADVNLQSSNGFTPLYMASQENHIEVVECLLQHGALQNLATEDGFTPLAVSLQQGHEKVVALLLEHDGGGGRMRLPALHIAAKKDDVRAAKLLLQNNSEKSNKAKNLVNDITKSGFTPLHIAAHYGNNNVGKLLIEHGADANFKARNLITPLHISSKWGRLAMVVLLLDCGAEVDPQTRDGLTPMHCAARSGHHQVVEALLKRGAKVEMKTVNGLTPLHMAIQGDHEVCAKILLLHNSGINEITVDYLTPLHVAAHCGNVKTAKLVLQDKKCEVNARALNGFTPLHIACKKNRIKIVELLLKHGATMEATTESGLTPLHVASFMGYLNIVLHLIQHGSNPNSPTCRGETSLHLAARANQIDIVRVLLRNGAAVQARSWDDQTALHVASRLGSVDNVVLLLRHGASPDDVTKDQSTPLHLAAREGHLEVIQVLLDHGSKKEIMNKKGFTALHLACKQNHPDIVEALLGRGCNCDQTSTSGLTPLHVCAHYDRPNIASLLLKNDAKIAVAAKNGYTPLHIAAKKNRMEIASMLLEAGASANSEINNGLTPLDLACQQGHVEMVQLLLENSADTNHRASKGVTSMHLTAQEDKVLVAPILLQHGASINAQTKAGYTPLHMACHYGQVGMVKFLLDNGAAVDATTKQGYTPLHHAAQQGHIQVVNLLLRNKASPNLLTNSGQSAMSIASRLGYVSIVEILRPVSDENAQPMTDDQEKYKVVLPEVVMETSLSESEDETVEDSMTLFFGKSYDQFPRGYDSIDSMALQQQHHHHHHHQQQQQQHDKQQKQLDNKIKQRVNSVMETSGDSTVYVQEEMMYMKKDVQLQSDPSSWVCSNDDGDEGIQSPGSRAPGFRIWTSFLVSFLVDARGGLYKGCRHSGLRVVVPPNHMVMPVRVMCRLVRRDKILSPPPLSDGEAIAGRIVDFAPSGVQLNGPILFEVPHSASLGGDREVVVVRSDDGLNWTIHHPPPPDNDPKMETLLNQVTELGLTPTPSDHRNKSSPVSHAHVITNHLPRYFALISRVKMEVKIMEGQGGVVSSKVVPLVQAVLSPGSVNEPSFFGLQAQDIPPSLVAKLAGNRAAVASIVTMEPQGKHFDKPVTITTPLPTPSQKGMINRYGKDACTPSSLRLLACSNRFSTFKCLYDNHPVYGVPGGHGNAADAIAWEDVTSTTPIKFQNDHASFNTSVAARFWLVDCPRSDKEVISISSEIFTEANRVPFLTRILVFAKRLSSKDAVLRVVMCADGEDFDGRAALEGQERFKEIARSKVVEVMEGKPMQIGLTGNLSLVAKSGEQLSIAHNSSEDSKLTFFVRVKDTCQPATGIMALLPLPQTTAPTDTSSTIVNPVCCLNIVMPEVSAASESGGDNDDEEEDEGTGVDQQHVVDSDEKDRLDHILKEASSMLNLRTIADLLQSDWLPLAAELQLTPTQIEDIQSNCEFQGEKALAMLQLWSNENEDPIDKLKLVEALKAIGRDDVVAAIEGPIKKKVMTFAQEASPKRKDYLDKNYDPLKDEIGSTCEFDSSRGSTLQPGMSLTSYEDHVMDDVKVENVNEVEFKSESAMLNAADVDEEEEDDADGDVKVKDDELRHVLNFNPMKNQSAVDEAVSEEQSVKRTTEESMELLPDGRKVRRTTETITKFTKTGDGDEEEEVKSIQVVENVTILGLGVEEPYDEDDVTIEVATEQSEQECEDGTSISRISTTTTVELKNEMTEVDEAIIIPTKAPAKPKRYHLEGEEGEEEEEKVYDEEGDDVDGFCDVTPTSPHHGDGDDVDDVIAPLDAPVEGTDPDADQVSVYEELLVKEEAVKSEATVDFSFLEKLENESADGMSGQEESLPIQPEGDEDDQQW